MGQGGSGQPLPWLASDAHPDSHECAKGAATLHHGFPDAAHQLPTPHSNPERGGNQDGANRNKNTVVNCPFPECVLNDE